MEKISVFGLGRVGLVMALCLAKHGHEVVGIDPDKNLLEKVRKGTPPFYEPSLQDYLSYALEKKTFRATHDSSANSESDMAYITVGTPNRPDGKIDLSYVEQVSKMIGQSLRGIESHQLVVIKSTVTPGTARNLVKPTIERESKKRAGVDFSICANPEFLREGNAIHDTEFPDRIIIGSDDAGAAEKLENFYRGFHRDGFPGVVRTSFENAELTKYANNAFLATKISFINSIANIAERIPHADVKSVASGIGLDERIGPQFLNAGLGWGGSCFPKDLRSLLSVGKSVGYDAELIAAVIETNRKQAHKAVEFARQALGSVAGKNISVLGLAFKPETDDMREAVAISIIHELLGEGAKVTVYDPQATENAQRIFEARVRYSRDAVECIEQADCCIVATEWDEFKKISPQIFIRKMRQPILIDGRRLYDAAEFRSAGVRLLAVGLGPEQ